MIPTCSLLIGSLTESGLYLAMSVALLYLGTGCSSRHTKVWCVCPVLKAAQNSMPAGELVLGQKLGIMQQV